MRRAAIGALTYVVVVIYLIAVGLPLGILAAVRENSWFDIVASSAAVLGMAVPGFLLGVLLLWALSVKVSLLPFGGYVSPFQDFATCAKSMILPAVTLGLPVAAVLMRQVRSAVLEVLGQDFILNAEARGLPGRVILFRHAVRNSLIPVLTVLGLQIGHLLGGVVIIESIFSIPGIGRLAILAINPFSRPATEVVPG